jgi:hypothetical protein
MKAGIVIVPLGSAAGLELLDGPTDGPADAAFGGLRQAEIAIFQKRSRFWASAWTWLLLSTTHFRVGDERIHRTVRRRNADEPLFHHSRPTTRGAMDCARSPATIVASAGTRSKHFEHPRGDKSDKRRRG